MENSESLNVAIENISLLFLVSFYKYLRMDHTMYGYGGGDHVFVIHEKQDGF